ncbi:MAG TPA: preprotein translocase subunit SecE [Bacteroidia bacterium]|nr:preprotein translocase subunit SecE [Bacteroidia bacterium]
MSKLRTYIDEVTDELMNKVSWPSAAELQSSAIVVLIAVVIVSLVIFTMDFSSSKIMTLFYSLFHK